MRIYTQVIVNMTTMQVINEKSYDYHGALALCCGGGGGGVSYPAPSAQETELVQLQLEHLKKMGKDAEALRPYLLSGMGFKEVGGKLTKMTEDEYYESLSGLDQKAYEVAMASAERSLKAYAGELDLSPALEKSLSQRKTDLTETLSRNLGSGWQGTTAGIQAMAQFDETSNLIREEVRSGIISNEGAMSLASLDYMSGIGDVSMSQFPGQQSGGMFSAAGGMADRYSRERQSQHQAALYSQQMKNQRSAGLMSGIGGLVGAGMGMYGMLRMGGR